MENKEEMKSTETRSLPQYGKKGHKPRNKREVSKVEYDKLHWNDPKYWNKLSTFNNVTKFSWDTVIGNPRNADLLFVKGTDDGYDNQLVKTGDYTVINPAAMMVMDTVIGPGWAEDVNDGVNLGLASIMAKIRASLSTSNIGFETADLGIFFAATGAIAAQIGQAKRMLEARKSSADRNYLYPRGIIASLGDDYDNVYNNINEYAARLNKCIDRYNEMNLIEGFDIYGRQYAMAHSIFMDEDSALGQLYAFRIRNYYVYQDTAKPSHAEYKNLANYKFETILAAIEEMLNAWYGSGDLYSINGVLLRAFKDAPRQHIANFSMDDAISPTVDRSFLMQIMNMSIVTLPAVGWETFNITQEPTKQNYVIWKPKGVTSTDGINEVGHVVFAERQMLRLFEDDISQDDNAELTRLLTFSDNDGTLRNCGSEIVTEVHINRYDATTNLIKTSKLRSNVVSLSQESVNTSAIAALMQIQSFRYIPAIYVWHTVRFDTTSESEFYGVVGDVYNWMLYSRKDWALLQREMYRSLWTTNL